MLSWQRLFYDSKATSLSKKLRCSSSQAQVVIAGPFGLPKLPMLVYEFNHQPETGPGMLRPTLNLPRSSNHSTEEVQYLWVETSPNIIHVTISTSAAVVEPQSTQLLGAP